MDQEQVKALLLQIHDNKEDFTVIFTGKKSKKVNGLYNTVSRKILIHNRNFTGEDGGLNESALIYTAIHELAHHICDTELHQKGSRCHTRLFWATFYDLVDAAVYQGLYTPAADPEVEALVAEARKLDQEIAALRRQLGGVLERLYEACEKKGLRSQDVLERRLQLDKKTVDIAVKVYGAGLQENISSDAEAAIVTNRDSDERAVMLTAARTGKSIAQIKQRPSPPPPAVDEAVKLEQEKRHIERSIALLSRRLVEVLKRLKQYDCMEKAG
jgi:hypothetical protein